MCDEEKHYCEIIDDVYYGRDGSEITALEYQKTCQKNYCVALEDGTYYDRDGNIVSKDEYNKSCQVVVENPQTGGNHLPIFLIILLLVSGIGIYLYVKKNSKFSHIS